VKFVINSFHTPREASTNTDVCTLEISVTKVTVSVFVKKSNVDRHQWTHTGEKPFECDVCNNSFISILETNILGLIFAIAYWRQTF
jgi:hypothetical protein